MIKMRSLRCDEMDDAAAEILRHSVGGYEIERAKRELGFYAAESARDMIGAFEGSVLRALIGVESRNGGQAVIKHLATSPESRRRGFARLLVEEVADRYGKVKIYAETDSESVGFYRSCGFFVEGIESPYPNVTRYGCTLQV